MGAAPSRETLALLLPQAPFYGQRQQVVLVPLISHFFPDADCPLFRQLYDTRCDPSVRYYQCVKEIFTDDVQKPGGGSGGESDATLVMECEEPECFPGTYFTRAELYDAYIRNGPERFLFDTDAAMLSAYQADPLNAVRPVPCAVAFLYHLPPRPPQSATTAAVDASGAQGGESPEAAAEAAAAATALVEPWLSEGCVEVLGCYVKITGFIGDVNMLNPNFTPSAKPDKAAATATVTSAMASLAALEADDDEARESTSCMELHMYLTKSAGDHNRTHVLLSAMYTYAEQWQRACLHYAAIQEEQEKTAAASAAAEATPEPEGTVDAAVGVVPAHVRAHTTTVGSTAVFDVTRNYSSASSSYYRKFLESKSATVMRSLLSATEAARESQKRQAPDSPDDVTEAERDDAQPKVISHLSGTKRQRAAPETAFLLWAAPPLPAARLHSRRTNVPLLCFLREVRAAFMSMHVCAENLRALQEIGDDSPLSDNIAVAPATLTCNCVEYEAALDDLIMWLETLPTQAPRHPVGSDAPTTTTTAEATDKASSGHDDAAQVAKPTREETYLTVYAPSWVVQRLLEHVVDCLLHNLSPLEILKAQRELQHQHNIDPPPPEPMPGTKNTAAVSTEASVAATTPPPPRTVCNCAMLKRMGKKCIHNGGDGPPCCCCSQNVDGTISRVPCRCSVNHSIGLETKQLRLPDEDIIVEEWPPRLPHSAAEASTASTSSAQKPDLRQLQTHRADHRLLYLVGEEPAGRQSATQCIVDWLAQGHSLTVGSSNANVAELEITVTLPHAEAAEEGDDGAGAAANEADPSNEKVTTGHCDCGDCDCEAGVAVTAQGFTIHQLPRMAPLAPFLSTVHHPHPAVWSRRTLEIFRQAAADHERAARERAAREGGEQRIEPAPLLLLRPGTVIELGRAVQGDAAAAEGGGGDAGSYREVRISCFPTEELLLAELRFASRKGREGHPDDPHWVRYGPGEGPPPSVPQDQSDDTARRAGRNEEDDEEDDDAIPPRPSGGENIVGDGSSCLWRMDLGDVADRILAVTPYFLKPTRKKHVKKKKAIPKAAAAHGTALNVFFYPLPPEETTTTTTPTSAGAAGEATAVVGAAEAGTATTAASAKTANGNKKKDDSSTAATAVSGAEVDADGPEAVTYDADGNPIPASEKAKRKKKKKNKKKANAADADGGEESGAGGEADDTDGVPTATQPTPAPAEVPEAPLKSEPADEAESTKAESASTAPAATVDAVPPAEPSTQTPSALLSSVTPLPRERQLNSDAPPFQSRQSSIAPEGSTGETTPARHAGLTTTTTTTTAAATSSVPLPRSRNAAAPAAPTTTTVPVSSGNRRPDALHTNWGYPYSEGVGMMDPNYYGPDGGMMMNPPLPPPPPGFMGAAAAAAGGAGYYYGMGMAPGMLPPPPPMPMGNAMMPPPGPYGFDGPPPPPDAYYGGYNPNGLPPPPPPHLAGPGGPGPYYPPSGPDGYGGYYNGGAGFGAGPGPQAAAAPARTIVPPVPRTRRQVSFGPTGEPIAVTTTATSGSSSAQPSLEAPNQVPSEVAAVASDRDAPPLLSHYNPAPMPSGLPPTSPTSRTGGLISPTIATLLPETHSVGSGLAGHGSGTGPGSELHVSVKVRHHHHHRTMSYLSESTTDAGAGSGVLHFSASHADMTEDSPHGTNHSLPVQSPVSATHRRQVSFSHLTTASSEPAGGAGIGSAHHSGVYAPVHHHHAHHSLTSNPAARPAGAGSSGHTGTGAGAGGVAGATATGVSGQAGLGMGSIKSGDTTSTTNTAKRMQASSNTYRWDWRSVTLDIGEEDQ